GIGEKIKHAVEKSLPPDVDDEILQAAPDDIRAKWKAEFADSSGSRMIKEVTKSKAIERVSTAISGFSDMSDKLSLYLPFGYDVRLLSQMSDVYKIEQFTYRDNQL